MPLSRSSLGIAIAMIGFVAYGTISTMALSGGPPANSAKEGCTCHSAQPSAGTTASLTGLPATYEGGKEYALTVSSTTDATGVASPQNYGGFQLIASVGEFKKPATNPDWVQVSTDKKTIMHTLMGDQMNQEQSWSVAWVAPGKASNPVTFYVAVNRVNGDGSNNDADHWNKITYTVPAQKKGAPGFEPVLVIAAVVAAGLLLGLAQKKA